MAPQMPPSPMGDYVIEVLGYIPEQSYSGVNVMLVVMIEQPDHTIYEGYYNMPLPTY